MSNEEYQLNTEADIKLTSEIFKSFNYDEKERFIKSQDGMVFFRKIRFSPIFKGLPSTTARLIDMLAGTADGGYYAREGKLDGAKAEEMPEQTDISLYPHKRLNSGSVESAIQGSSFDLPDSWTKSTDLMRLFKASEDSIVAALHDALEDGRITKGMYSGETVYACA